MSESQYFCPRLIDYLAIVGAHPNSSKKSSLYELQNNGTNFEECRRISSSDANSEKNFGIQNPELLRRYPDEDHKDFILPETMSYFCQPEGCVLFTHSRSESNKVTSFVFTLTDKDTTRTRYGVCVNFYRRIDQCFTNTLKNINTSGDHDHFLNQNQKNHSSVFLKCHSTSFSKSFSQDNSTNPLVDTVTTNIPAHSESQDVYSLTSLCLLSHHPLFSSFRTCLFYLKNIIDSYNEKMNQSRKERYKRKECIWSLITGLMTKESSPRVVQYIKEIEAWILRLLSAPVPVPGKTKLEVFLFPQKECQQPLIFALPDHTRFTLIDFPLHLPLELLGVDTCLYVLTIILLENKVVFQSKDYNALSMSVMALVALMYPLQYMFTVIPLLPTSLPKSEMLFESPVPYVVGVPSSFFSTKRDFRFPKDVWIIDLDSNKITPPIVLNREDAIPQLPKSESTILKNNLKTALNGLSRISTNNKNKYHDEIMSPTEEDILNRKIENLQFSRNDSYVNNNSNQEKEIRRQTSTNIEYNPVDIDSVDIAIRVAMVRFFLSGDVLANLTEHSRTLRLYPRPVVFFQINSFLKSRSNPSLFTCHLARTQAVDYFAEWSLTPNNVVFQRIQTGVYDPSMIGDKLKWFTDNLEPISFIVWQEKCSIQNIINININSNRYPINIGESERSENYDDGTSSSDDEKSLKYQSNFKINITSDQKTHIENQRLNIGPIIQDIHSTYYEPPVTLHIPMTLYDSPDDDGTLESIGSKSIGSSPSSSHSDMSSPMFKSQSIIDIVRCSQSQQPHPQLTATVTSNKSLLSRQNTGGSDSALNNIVLAQKQTNIFRPTSQISTTSEFYQQTPINVEKKQSITSSQEPLSRKESLNSLHQQLTRQSSQNSSILEHFAFQAKELVKETARQSSQEGAGGIFAQVADKLTTQAKKAAGEATKSVHEVSKSAIEASKTAAGVSKNTFDDLTYVGKSKIGDLTKSAKQVASKKGFKVGLLGESTSSQQAQSFDDDISDTMHQSPNPISTNSISDIRKTSISSVGSGSTKEFFSNITSDINGLANQTSSMFNDLFGGNKPQNNKSSLTLPVNRNKERISGPFPTKGGRGDLVEKSNLIRHSNPRKLSETSKVPNKKSIKASSHVDNETFLKDVTKQILNGDGIGWLKLSRFKKLMEEEGYRNLVLSKLNRTLDNKISPSDHIDDVYISRPVWKGMLKALLAIIHGLEVSFANQCGNGLSSAFQVLEIAHTHYWTKDMAGFESQTSSPYGSHENVQSPLQSPSLAGSPISSVYQTSRKSSQTSTSGLSECKNSGGGKFAHEFSLMDDGEGSTTNISSNEMFNDLMNLKNIKQEHISTNPFLENESELSAIGPVVSDESSCHSGSVLVNNPSFYLKRMTNNNSKNNTLFRSAVSDSELDNTGLFKVNNKGRTQSIWSSKSSLSAGFRYHGGNLLNTASGSPSPDSGRTYLFEGILGKERSTIWNQLKFWEDVFIDAVSQERDMIGMDQGPIEMMERYKNLNQSERKRLEYDEDKLLSIMIYNLIAFMIMVNVPKESVMKIVRTLVGKSRVTNCYATEITSLMSQLSNLNGNDVDLKPLNSRQAHRQSFAVHCGDSSGELLFLEVRDDGLVLRSVSGVIVSRWWYERIVNMTYSPRSKIFCLWRTANGGQLQLNKYYTKKCKDLYTRIKHSMEKAAERGQGIIPGVELGGEFPVKDMATGEGGILQVCMEGVGLLFADSKDFEFFVRLDHVRKCFTVQKKIFVLEEYNPKLKHIIQRQYESPMAGQICYAVLCVFSYIAAGHKRTVSQSIKEKAQRQLSTSTESSDNKIC